MVPNSQWVRTLLSAARREKVHLLLHLDGQKTPGDQRGQDQASVTIPSPQGTISGSLFTGLCEGVPGHPTRPPSSLGVQGLVPPPVWLQCSSTVRTHRSQHQPLQYFPLGPSPLSHCKSLSPVACFAPSPSHRAAPQLLPCPWVFFNLEGLLSWFDTQARTDSALHLPSA